MRFTAAQYDAAIQSLQCAKDQLDADGNCCSVCGDGHYAWECGHNPLLAMQICQQIAEQSNDLHDTLHRLAGFDFRMGQQLGPRRVIVPATE